MSADLTDRLTIDEAFKILLPAMKPHEARVLLNAAIATDKVGLCANDSKVLPDWFEMHLKVGATDADGRWTAKLLMIRAVENFHTTTWTVSRLEVMTLLAETKPQKHAGGRPRVYDQDEIRAVAFIALSRFLKKAPFRALFRTIIAVMTSWPMFARFSASPARGLRF
jgi:hypothetical protein